MYFPLRTPAPAGQLGLTSHPAVIVVAGTALRLTTAPITSSSTAALSGLAAPASRRHPTASLGSSLQFLPSRVYKHRPQESTWWAKNCTGEGGAQVVLSVCSSWSCLGREVVLSVAFWFALQLCDLCGNGLRPQYNKGCRGTAGCGGQSLSLILESCALGDQGRSINLARQKHCTALTPFGTGQTHPVRRCRSKQEACVSYMHTDISWVSQWTCGFMKLMCTFKFSQSVGSVRLSRHLYGALCRER